MFKYYFVAQLSLLALILVPGQIGRHFAGGDGVGSCPAKAANAALAREQLSRMAAQRSSREAIAGVDALRADRDSLRAAVAELKDDLAALRVNANTANDGRTASEAELQGLRQKLADARAYTHAHYLADLKQLREETKEFIARSDANLELLARGRDDLQDQLLASRHQLRLAIARSIAKRQKYQRSLLTIESLRRQLTRAAKAAQQPKGSVQLSSNDAVSAVEKAVAVVPPAIVEVPASPANVAPPARKPPPANTVATAPIKTSKKGPAKRRPKNSQFDDFVFP